MAKIIYNQIQPKIGTHYTDGPVEGNIINVGAWDLHKLFDNLNHDVVLCISMGDFNLTYNSNEFRIGNWHDELFSFKDWPKNVKHVFCTHCAIKETTICEGIPAGIMYSDNSNVHLLEIAEKINIEPTQLLLLKYAPTHPVRNQLIHYLNWATYEKADKEMDVSYFLAIKKHLFTLCPPGLGKDSYRVWETLYMNRIPIVQSNCHHWFNLPILIVDELFNLTPSFLDRKYKEFEARWNSYNWEQLTEEWWIEYITQKAKKILEC